MLFLVLVCTYNNWKSFRAGWNSRPAVIVREPILADLV